MQNIIVYDLETTGKDPNKVYPIQFAAIPIDGTSLKIKEDDVFNQMCKPPDFEDMANYKGDSEKEGLWKFHAEHRGVSIAQVIELVGASPPMNIVFSQFREYVKRFKNKKDPELGGFNICNYDNVIINRLLKEEKLAKGTWSPIFFHDVMQDCKSWLRSADMRSMSLDSLREHFGLTKGGHEALKDCKDTAQLLARFLKFKQELASGHNYFAKAFKQK
jgi:DNA polymerase III epsilon subunit-like protein